MMPDNITALTVTTVLIQHCKVINLISLADLKPLRYNVTWDCRYQMKIIKYCKKKF